MSDNTRVAVRDAAAPADSTHVAQDSSKPEQSKVQHDKDSKGIDSPEQEEFGGQPGPDPTRYGDWEKKGRVTDF